MLLRLPETTGVVSTRMTAFPWEFISSRPLEACLKDQRKVIYTWKVTLQQSADQRIVRFLCKVCSKFGSENPHYHGKQG